MVNSRREARILKVMKVLVIDIGGTNVKVASSDRRVPIKIPSGPDFTAAMMASDVLAATVGWTYDATTNTITLHGASCDMLTSNASTQVGVLYGCPGPPPIQ